MTEKLCLTLKPSESISVAGNALADKSGAFVVAEAVADAESESLLLKDGYQTTAGLYEETGGRFDESVKPTEHRDR